MKKILFIIMALLLCSFAIADTYKQTERIGDAVFETVEYTGLSKIKKWFNFGQLAITIAPKNPKPDTNANIYFGGGISNNCYPNRGLVEVIGSGRTILRHEISTLPSAGSSYESRLNFHVPNDADGRHTARYTIYGSSNPFGGGQSQICDADQTSFEVEGVNECDADYCDDWQVTKQLDGGQELVRVCYEYDEDCNEDKDVKTIIECDSGYKESGNKCVKITTTTQSTTTTVEETTTTTIKDTQEGQQDKWYVRFWDWLKGLFSLS